MRYRPSVTMTTSLPTTFDNSATSPRSWCRRLCKVRTGKPYPQTLSALFKLIYHPTPRLQNQSPPPFPAAVQPFPWMHCEPGPHKVGLLQHSSPYAAGKRRWRYRHATEEGLGIPKLVLISVHSSLRGLHHNVPPQTLKNCCYPLWYSGYMVFLESQSWRALVKGNCLEVQGKPWQCLPSASWWCRLCIGK